MKLSLVNFVQRWFAAADSREKDLHWISRERRLSCVGVLITILCFLASDWIGLIIDLRRYIRGRKGWQSAKGVGQ